MARSARGIAVISLFATGIWLCPATASACNQCSEALLYYHLPFLPFALKVLLAWRAAYAVWQVASSPRLGLGRLSLDLFARLLALAALYLVVSGAAWVVYLTASIVKAFWRSGRNLLRGRRTADPPMRGWRSPATALVLHCLAFFAVTPVAAWTIVRANSLDSLDRLVMYASQVPDGTVVYRGVAQEIRSDPSFDPERLRPLLRSPGSADFRVAESVLYARRSFGDLERFADELSGAPLFRSLLRDRAASTPNLWADYPIYLVLWLDELEVPKGIGTVEGLSEWIAVRRAAGEERSAPPVPRSDPESELPQSIAGAIDPPG